MGTTKDRFNEFKALSEQFGYSDDETDFAIILEEAMSNDDTDALLYSDNDWGLVEEFLARVSRVQNGLHLLESYVEDVKIKHSQLLVSPHEDSRTKQELSQAMDAFQQLSENVRTEVKSMEGEVVLLQKDREQRDLDSNAIDIRIREAHHMGLSRRLHMVLKNYAVEQARFKDRCKERIQGYLDLTGKRVSDDEMEDMIHDGEFFEIAGGLLTEQKRYAQQIIDDLESRRDDILRLEQSIRELHSMFKDMAMLVEMQGDLVDRIEYNVENAVDYSACASGHMKQAKRFRDQYRKKRIGLIGCVVLSLLVAFVCGAIYLSLQLGFLLK